MGNSGFLARANIKSFPWSEKDEMKLRISASNNG